MRVALVGMVLAGAGVLGTGCATDPAKAELAGVWARPVTIPGSFFRITLDERAGDVTGLGCFAMEAGPGGTVTATGTRAGVAVMLEISWYVAGSATPIRTGRYDARLTDNDHLGGAASDGTMLDLRRTSASPPTC